MKSFTLTSPSCRINWIYGVLDVLSKAEGGVVAEPRGSGLGQCRWHQRWGCGVELGKVKAFVYIGVFTLLFVCL